MSGTCIIGTGDNPRNLVDNIPVYTHKRYNNLYMIEFRESYVSTGQTDVKQGKSVECISRAKVYFRENHKSQNNNHISSSPYNTDQRYKHIN